MNQDSCAAVTKMLDPVCIPMNFGASALSSRYCRGIRPPGTRQLAQHPPDVNTRWILEN